MRRILLVTLLLYLPTIAAAQVQLKLLAGDYPPFLSDRLVHQGVIAYIVKEAGKRQGMEIEIAFTPWQQAKMKAQEGAVHGTVGWGYTSKREKDFIYSAPIYTETVVFFHLKNRHFDWQSLASLNGLRVGISESYIEDAMLANFNQQGGDVVVRRYPNEVEKLRSLLTGDTDVIIGNQYVVMNTLRTVMPDDTRQHITFHPKPLRVTPLHVLLSRQHPDSARWVARLNRGINQLKNSGDYQRAWTAFRMGEFGVRALPSE
ncbi:hypothetical protein BZG06_03035 [Salinivibrio kushneri]|uniref:Solute-binding protein family 3/N-terminal domain-containing protein n=1 Tax=Salinivibrio kushneri TaxID=1908198 RepID=A0AB36K6L7_9GAMM|nr:transporter substrate-binding domain-containing protein [Salinivibrio kushneri]OOE44151.1 hypothetical protein BZG09_08365 [Salinivibrio kushneri]OOE47380.1 hypothetical protein BZG06_03035 [Salinivibrio kushneri]